MFAHHLAIAGSTPIWVLICVSNHARAGMYLALTVSVSLSVLMF
jgi:hypothetical protein